jgi:hypothetical protein
MTTTETAYNFDRLTPAQIDVLGNVAFGGKGHGCRTSTLKVLEHKGLIESYEQAATDRFGTMTWKEWTMPIHVHIRFCQWCEEVGGFS